MQESLSDKTHDFQIFLLSGFLSHPEVMFETDLRSA